MAWLLPLAGRPASLPSPAASFPLPNITSSQPGAFQAGGCGLWPLATAPWLPESWQWEWRGGPPPCPSDAISRGSQEGLGSPIQAVVLPLGAAELSPMSGSHSGKPSPRAREPELRRGNSRGDTSRAVRAAGRVLGLVARPQVQSGTEVQRGVGGRMSLKELHFKREPGRKRDSACLWEAD